MSLRIILVCVLCVYIHTHTQSPSLSTSQSCDLNASNTASYLASITWWWNAGGGRGSENIIKRHKITLPCRLLFEIGKVCTFFHWAPGFFRLIQHNLQSPALLKISVLWVSPASPGSRDHRLSISSRAMVLNVWSPDWQHPHQFGHLIDRQVLGTSLASHPRLLNQELSHPCFHKSSWGFWHMPDKVWKSVIWENEKHKAKHVVTDDTF